MRIISHVLLGLAYYEKVPDRIREQWAEGLKNNAARFHEKRQQIIPNQESFMHKIAETSHKQFGDMLDPNFQSRAGLNKRAIVNKHSVNLSSPEAYQKYRTKLGFMFEEVDGVPAKRYKERIDLTKGHYGPAVIKKLLAFSGTKVEGKGPAAVASLWLTRDPTTEGQISGKDKILEGGPTLITKPAHRAGFKAALTGRLIQAGSAIVRSGNEPGTIQEQNDLTNDQINGFVDKHLHLVDFATGGPSHVDYVVTDDQRLILEIQVSQK
jgi:hypothetical protein